MSGATTFTDLGRELDHVLRNISFARIKYDALPTPRIGHAADTILARIEQETMRQATLEAQLTKKSTFPPCFDREGLRRMYDSPVLSDVVICFGAHSVRAHKFVLSMSSEYFNSAFTKGFVESKKGQLELFEDDPDAVTGMLKYIYGQDPFQGRGDGPGIQYHLELFTVAGKYQLDNLLTIAGDKAKEKMAVQWEEASFPGLLRTIYTEMPMHGGQLREAAKEICGKHIIKLKQVKEFKELLLEVPDLAFDIIDVVSREQEAW